SLPSVHQLPTSESAGNASSKGSAAELASAGGGAARVGVGDRDSNTAAVTIIGIFIKQCLLARESARPHASTSEKPSSPTSGDRGHSLAAWASDEAHRREDVADSASPWPQLTGPSGGILAFRVACPPLATPSSEAGRFQPGPVFNPLKTLPDEF